MGKGIDAARDDAPEHAAVMDDMKDQLLITLFKRLGKDTGGKVDIPFDELDDTGGDLLSFSINQKDRVFYFDLSKKS